MSAAGELIGKLRTLGIEPKPDGRGGLVVEGDTGNVTPDLIAELRKHRDDIVKELTAKPPEPKREWLWANGWHHLVDDGFPPKPWHPTGAWFWRLQGETTWRAVPGRPGETTAPPQG